MIDFGDLHNHIHQSLFSRHEGKVTQAVGTLVEANLPGASLGSLCQVAGGQLCQVVGFRERKALLMSFDPLEGVAYGSPVVLQRGSIRVPVGDSLIGRVIDPLGRPLDDGPPLRTSKTRPVDASPPEAMERQIIDEPLYTGVKALDGLLTFGKGQRVALMAGSGVGKSTLLGMIARTVKADVNVICLVGERGREVREFVERDLGPEGLSRSVLIVVTSDKSPVLQVKGAFTASAIAEYFREQGKDVVLMMDSLTRFAMAQRQIGLTSGEPPTTRGYTPSVFGALPRLLERAGPGPEGQGSISGIYTVLVEGDDMNDPIGDATRGIVDGHVVLSRRLGSHGHYPAIDVLESLSRVMRVVTTERHQELAAKVRDVLATWEENEELIRLGAYKRGSDNKVDFAISKRDALDKLLRQKVHENIPVEATLRAMTKLVSGK